MSLITVNLGFDYYPEWYNRYMAKPAVDRTADAGLVPVGYQFPLSRPMFDLPSADVVPPAAPVPFGIRFFRPAGDVCDRVPIPYHYDSGRQVAVADDGSGTPLIFLTRLEKTTTGTPDGESPRGEDFMTDPVKALP